MSITFGGLATGMDTSAIVDALMEIERQPIERMERDKAYFTSRLQAFNDLDSKLSELQEKAEAIDSAKELNAPSVTSASEEFFTASADNTADLGNYQIEVVSLAQRQKDVSQGYADSAAKTFGTGDLVLNVGGVDNTISIDGTNNSLAGIAGAINDADLGVSASIINDGSATPYRLVLTADTVDAVNPFSLDASGLSGGTDANPVANNVVVPTQAEIKVDTISIKSDSNTISDGIAGVTVELLKKNEVGATTVMNVEADPDATKSKIKDFVTAYNKVIDFVAEQKDADWAHDSSFRSVIRRLQNMLTTPQSGGSGTYSTLAELGFETQTDGTIALDDTALSDAMDTDYAGVISLFAGEDGVDGVSKTFASYLDSMTDSIDGLYASKKAGTDRNNRRIDQQMERLEARMASREETIRAQFSAMEELVSSLNAQSSFLTQQMSSLSQMNRS